MSDSQAAYKTIDIPLTSCGACYITEAKLGRPLLRCGRCRSRSIRTERSAYPDDFSKLCSGRLLREQAVLCMKEHSRIDPSSDAGQRLSKSSLGYPSKRREPSV